MDTCISDSTVANYHEVLSEFELAIKALQRLTVDERFAAMQWIARNLGGLTYYTPVEVDLIVKAEIREFAVRNGI
jgi:hypothetical protein